MIRILRIRFHHGQSGRLFNLKELLLQLSHVQLELVLLLAILGMMTNNAHSGLYIRSPAVNYDIILPDGTTYHNGNPSGNQEWEQFKISDNAADVPNQADYSHIWLVTGWDL